MRFIRVRAPIRFTSPVTTAAPAPIQDALTSAALDAWWGFLSAVDV